MRPVRGKASGVRGKGKKWNIGKKKFQVMGHEWRVI